MVCRCWSVNLNLHSWLVGWLIALAVAPARLVVFVVFRFSAELLLDLLDRHGRHQLRGRRHGFQERLGAGGCQPLGNQLRLDLNRRPLDSVDCLFQMLVDPGVRHFRQFGAALGHGGFAAAIVPVRP